MQLGYSLDGAEQRETATQPAYNVQLSAAQRAVPMAECATLPTPIREVEGSTPVEDKNLQPSLRTADEGQ